MTETLNVFTLSALFASSIVTIIIVGVLVFEYMRCSGERRLLLLPLLGTALVGVVLISILTYDYLLGAAYVLVRFSEFALITVMLILFIFAMVRLRSFLSKRFLIILAFCAVLLFLVYSATLIFPTSTRAITAFVFAVGSVSLYFFTMDILIKTGKKGVCI